MNEQAVDLHGAASAEITPFRCIEGDVEMGCLLICDHASNAFPGGQEALGLGADQLERHIAYDIGAAAVTERLSALIAAPAVLSGFSRLLIDPNRGLDDPTLVMQLSDGAVIPANRLLDEAEKARRVRLYYEPYHSTIDARIDAAIDAGIPPTLFSIHSFTPHWKGCPRPWHATVLWDRDTRLPLPLVEGLRGENGLVIGENVPYSGELKGDSLYRHGTARGLAHALIEIRQDLIADEAGQKEWAERLARILTRLFQEPTYANEFRTIRHYGSQADANED